MKRAELLREHARTMLKYCGELRGSKTTLAYNPWRADGSGLRISWSVSISKSARIEHTKLGQGGSPCIGRSVSQLSQ